ncbi:hypothetical protein [Reinekea thalattae]|uniref:Uncharacterized protein n=1 Tax=Reinekea thalattae TaxID=2593301 RepID=A0A5C8ZBC0_9GAMM|nr:hypothetical protein [Reinekea thalattae]TXR54579.1 hypothetical protein FME95_08595 [Reinekea thalattae]
MKRNLFVTLAIAIISISLVAFFQISTLRKNNDIKPTTEPLETWWQTTKPDLIIEQKEYYFRDCSIKEVNSLEEQPLAKTIFRPPTKLMTSCDSLMNPLDYKEGYIILTICRQTFGAGSCTRERYRSNDMAQWQEDIGITWVKGEQYTAWRNIGSTSSKADAVTRIE